MAHQLPPQVVQLVLSRDATIIGAQSQSNRKCYTFAKIVFKAIENLWFQKDFELAVCPVGVTS